jgi:nitrogen fixation NifU-like protein
MTEALRGLTLAQARQRFAEFHAMITAPVDAPTPDLGKLRVLAGVREFPTRVKCASLAWHTAKALLDGSQSEAVTTE